MAGRTNHKIRVAVIGDYPIGKQSADGGVQAVLMYLVRAIKAIPHIDLHIITFSREGMSTTEKESDLTLHIIPGRPFGPYTLFRSNLKGLNQCLQSIKPHLLHAQGAGMEGYVSIKSKVPTIITFHGVIRENAKYLKLSYRKFRLLLMSLIYEKYCLKHAEYVIAISPYVKEYFGSRLNGRIFHIPNPVAEAYFTPTQSVEDGRVLFAGKIIPLKGVADLVEAVQLIKGRVKIKVVLAGSLNDMAYVKEVKQLIASNKMEDTFRLTGLLHEDEILKEFRRCHMLVLPSYQESSPMVIQQAMAAGKAVLATRTGGVPGLVEDGKSGFLFKPGDTAALSDLLLRMLSSRVMCRDMGSYARKTALKRFQPAEIAKQTADVYDIVKKETTDQYL